VDRKILLLAAALSLTVPAPIQTVSTAPDMIRKIESRIVPAVRIGPASPQSLVERMKAFKIPGLSVAVVKDSAVDWAKGYGVRDAGTGEPVTAETLFQAASITKSITAAVTLRLVEEGRLDLDEDVNHYLKRWQVPENEFTKTEKVTLRRVLSHTAGLTVSGFRGYAEGEAVPTILEVLDGLPPANSKPVRVDRTPGSGYRYSGGGYTILQVLLEDVTGRPLPELAAEYVFKPAGMTHSVICLCNAPGSLAGLAASGHSCDGAPFKGYTFLRGGSACCELWTTPSDLARFMIALQRSLRGEPGGILAAATVRTMMAGEGAGGRPLGLMVRRGGDAVYFGHDGGNVGFVSRFLGSPDKRCGLAVMINSDCAFSMIDDLTSTVAAAYGWDGFKTESYESAAALVEELRRGHEASPSGPEYSEAALNEKGYDLLRQGFTDAAVGVFRLNVELEPRSANAADSLAEGLEKAGDAAGALSYYRKALELLDAFPERNAGFRASRPSVLDGIARLDKESREAGPAELDMFIKEQVRELGLAGLAACIFKDGRLAWAGGAGLADIEAGRAAGPETVFPVGSVSKTVTLAAFMRLWEQGRCALDDDVNKYLSFPLRNPRYPDKPVTLRMLLSFTAGIFDVDMQAGENRLSFLEETRDPKTSAEEVLREFLVPGGKYFSEKNYFDYAPGARYAYSNSSYALVGCVIERLSGRPFWEYCRRAIFEPLRMTHSSWRLADLDRGRAAFAYWKGPDGMKKEEPAIWPGYMDGGLWTTAGDIGNFLLMMADRGRFDGKQVLKPETVDAMLALQNPPGAPAGRGFPVLGRGFVWTLNEVRGRRLFQMNGFGPAFFAEVYFDPERKTGGAFFTTGGFSSFEVLGNTVRLFFDKLLDATDRLPPAP
jgi:CubicO group peptidase (beta-lactamase class C family)